MQQSQQPSNPSSNNSQNEAAKKLNASVSSNEIINNPNSLMNRSKSLSNARNSIGADSATSIERKKTLTTGNMATANIPKLGNKKSVDADDKKEKKLKKKSNFSLNSINMMF